jgi:hypothetical protein
MCQEHSSLANFDWVGISYARIHFDDSNIDHNRFRYIFSTAGRYSSSRHPEIVLEQ